MIREIGAVLLSFSLSYDGPTGPTTIADQLQLCQAGDIESFQPVTSFSFDANARSHPKQPLHGRPCDGPKEVYYPEGGPLTDSVIVSVNIPIVHDVITEGSVSSPIIDPTNRRVSVIVYTCSEDKLYGAGGRIDATITGRQQKVATASERRRVLVGCLKKLGAQ